MTGCMWPSGGQFPGTVSSKIQRCLYQLTPLYTSEVCPMRCKDWWGYSGWWVVAGSKPREIGIKLLGWTEGCGESTVSVLLVRPCHPKRSLLFLSGFLMYFHLTTYRHTSFIQHWFI